MAPNLPRRAAAFTVDFDAGYESSHQEFKKAERLDFCDDQPARNADKMDRF